MSLLAIELNDAALVGAGPDGPVFGAPEYVPGYAALVDGRVLFGQDAWQQSRLHPRSTTHRFWHDFSEQPLPQSFGPYTASADLVHGHLQSLLDAGPLRPAGVLFAVPPYWTTTQLGLLLGLAEEMALPVRGLVDSAVAATRGEYADQQLVHLDAALHGLTITRLDQVGRVALSDRQAVDGVGIIKLESACAAYIAGSFLQATRFDPLHDALSEQFLYDSLYIWLRELNRQDEIGITIEFGGNEFRAKIRRADLAARISDAFEPAARQVRSSIGANERVAIQVTGRLAEFPGVIDALTSLPQANVFVLEPAAAASGALQRADQFVPSAAGVGLTTSLAWDRVTSVPAATDAQQAGAREIVEPTHVLYDGRVYRLGSAVFNVGAELADGEFGLRLGRSFSGVSRRHCSIRRGMNGVELIDHSRFGTQLNGHAIKDAVILRAGDVIGIGSPPVTLSLVREVSTHGA